MVEGTNLPPTIQMSMNFRNFVHDRIHVYHCTKFKAHFPVVSMDVPNFSMSKVEKPWKGLFRTDVIRSKKSVVC